MRNSALRLGLGYSAGRRHELTSSMQGPNTNKSQFFMTLAKTSWLDDKHVVFGKVVDGLEILKILET